MIRVRYFDNLMWVDWCLGAILPWTSLPLMINPPRKHPQLRKNNLSKPNHSMKYMDPNQTLMKATHKLGFKLLSL